MSEDRVPGATPPAAGTLEAGLRRGVPVDAQKWASRLALVNRIARAAHAKLEMGDLLNTIVEAVHEHFGFYDVSVFLVDTEAGECVLVAQAGSFQAEGIEGYRQKIGVGIVGWVAEHGETVVANDLRAEPRRLIAFEGEKQLLSALAVPIQLNGRAVGVINVQNVEANAFDDCDVLAIETLSEQIAQAIANAQLFERTRLLRDLNRGIIDAMPSGLCVLDARLKVLYANPSFCDLLKAEAKDLNGRDVRDILPAPLLRDEGLEGALELALREGRSRVLANVTADLAGVRRAVNVRVAPAPMPEGSGVLTVFEDVTLWRKAMDLAEERRAHLALIAEHVPIAVMSFGLDGTITYWGAGDVSLFKRSGEDVVGRVKAWDVFDDPAAFQSLVRECEEADSARGELTLTRPDGTRTPLLVVIGKLADREGRRVGCTAVVVDITERVRARDELLREKKKLDDVVEVIGAGLALIDRQRRIVWANRTLEQWFGRGRDAQRLRCHDLYCQRETACAICPAAMCFATGKNGEAEVALIRADGQLRQYHHAVTPIYGPTGEIEQVLKLTLDVTDQTKKVYQLARLRQLGELMQGVLDLDRLLHFVLTCVTAGQALGFNRAILMLVDRDRNVVEGKMGVGPASAEEAGRIWSELTRTAPTLEALLGLYDEDRGAGESAMTRVARQISVPLEDKGHILAQCALGMKTIIVRDAPRDPRVPEDLRRLLGAREFVLVPLIARNSTVGILMADNFITGQPISEELVELLSMFAAQAALAIENAENYANLEEDKRHLERAYRDLSDAQDKLVRSERLVAIGRMAAHIAHEIRNPLVTIGGFANMIVSKLPPDAPDAARYAQIIQSEVRRLENILARVMDFSKPPRPLLREGDLAAVVRETLDQFRERAAAQGVEVASTFRRDAVRMQIDPEQVKQVLINLFQNALDVMKDGGRLSVEVDADGRDARIVVGNTGELIRPEHMASMFEPFFSTKPGGTGLGLAVSQKIVQEHGGDIQVSSALDQGTRFTVRLPLNADRNGGIATVGS